MATDGKAKWWNASSGAPTYNAQELRQLDSFRVMPGPASEPFSGRPGRRVNGKGLEVSVSSTGNGSVTVSAGTCLMYASAQAVQGVWEATYPQVGPIALGARPAAGLSRIVKVLSRVYDSDISVGSVKEAKIELLAGSDNATPTAPSIPAGAIAFELGQLTVPASGTITFTQSTQRTVAAGGILPVATVAERDALKTDGIAYEGMFVDVAATDTLYRYDGTNWVMPGGPVGRGVSGSVNVNALYLNNTPANIAGPWTPTSPQRAGGSRAHVKVQISAYAGANQEAAHSLQAQINGGAWTELDAIYPKNVGVNYLPLGGTVSGWCSFNPSDTLSFRLSTFVANLGPNVGVGTVEFSATFF